MANVKVMDGTVRHPELYGKYDAVLIDAPCSGLGVPGKPDARYAKTDAIIDEIAGIQKKLLDACADYVKPGGVLIYATCTISKRENEEQAKAFMERNGCFEKGSFPVACQRICGKGFTKALCCNCSLIPTEQRDSF